MDRHFLWENTNYMLRHPGYNGLKTGITEAAGPCLSASYQSIKGQWFIIILLNSRSMLARWEEVPVLVEWAQSHNDTNFSTLPEVRGSQKHSVSQIPTI
jgi:D-alanyl-D-alanine carboxypeptidase